MSKNSALEKNAAVATIIALFVALLTWIVPSPSSLIIGSPGDNTKDKSTLITKQQHLPPSESAIAECDVTKTGSPQITIDTITANWDGLESKRAQWVKEGRSLTPELATYICGEADKNSCQHIQMVEGQTRKREMQSGLVLIKVFNFVDNPPVKVKFSVKCPD